jgi:hypothetical protein
VPQHNLPLQTQALLEELLLKTGVDVPDEEGSAALHYAAANGQETVSGVCGSLLYTRAIKYKGKRAGEKREERDAAASGVLFLRQFNHPPPLDHLPPMEISLIPFSRHNHDQYARLYARCCGTARM